MTKSFVSAAIAFVLLGGGAVTAQVTREEALGMVYRGATFRMEQVFLTPAQQGEVAARSGESVISTLIARYIAARGSSVLGRAYVDTHTVRTKRESLLISLDQAGRLKRIDVTAFLEPTEYRAPEAWLKQYQGHELDSGLELNRAIRPIAGASLTARAVNSAVRRVLAIDEVLREAAR